MTYDVDIATTTKQEYVLLRVQENPEITDYGDSYTVKAGNSSVLVQKEGLHWIRVQANEDV